MADAAISVECLIVALLTILIQIPTVCTFPYPDRTLLYIEAEILSATIIPDDRGNSEITETAIRTKTTANPGSEISLLPATKYSTSGSSGVEVVTVTETCSSSSSSPPTTTQAITVTYTLVRSTASSSIQLPTTDWPSSSSSDPPITYPGSIPPEAPVPTHVTATSSYLASLNISSYSFPVSTSVSGFGSVATSATSESSPSTSTGSQSYTTYNMSGNIFVPVATDAPPAQVKSRPDHPVPRTGIVNQNGPIETNKFYANFFLGNQTQGCWTHPYSLSWVRGGGNASSWGIAVTHIERSMLAFGPGSPPQYFINPIGIQHLILSATELGGATTLTSDSLQAFSANINLAPTGGAAPILTMPVVQGMGFATCIYRNATPMVQSGVFIRNANSAGNFGNGVKYRITLEDNSNWLVYFFPTSGGVPAMNLVRNTTFQGNGRFTGFIQVAKNPAGANGESYYDRAAGAYATGLNLSASISGSTANYTFGFQKGGQTNKPLIMFALPHHNASLNAQTAGTRTPIQLTTTTKGLATALLADTWTMTEANAPTDMGFAPWSPRLRSVSNISQTAINAINAVAQGEVNQDYNAQTNLNSMYFSGKGLGKLAMLTYALNDLAKNTGLARQALDKLKACMAVFVDNRQIFPLVYETAWKGVVSTGSYQTGDAGLDFGNTFYNDHHFHYGYFVYSAAVIGYLDPSWLNQGSNRAWINMLVRDFANPSTQDTYFPFSRSFDWFHGHSWAKGLFESADGKDQESTSEDMFASYAIKMWGRTVGDPNMEARGNLMLAVQRRSFSNYFLLEDNNTVQPSQFIPNKVTGILFENKVDHATYFGGNIEYIQGIHMIPLSPPSAYIRAQAFVSQEWSRYFSNGRVDQIGGGWRGILYANLAIIDPNTAWNFFNQPGFDYGWLDGGASRTWYLAYVAGLGGAGTQGTNLTQASVEQMPLKQVQRSVEEPQQLQQPQQNQQAAGSPNGRPQVLQQERRRSSAEFKRLAKGAFDKAKRFWK